MKHPIAWMTAGSAGTCAAAYALSGGEAGLELPAGMLAPLVAAVSSWMAVERQQQRDPAGVQALMLRAFAVKAVFFAAYVVIALEGLALRPVPFVLSFTAYFISLYFAEALCLVRLFAGRMHQAR